jgi:hypothetical protein
MYFLDVREHLWSLGGGRGGIRTPDTLSGTPVFKTGAINHSATLPFQILVCAEDKRVTSPEVFGFSASAITKFSWSAQISIRNLNFANAFI